MKNMWCSPVSIVDGDTGGWWEFIKAIALRLLKEEHERKLKVARGEEWQTVGRKGRKYGCRWNGGEGSQENYQVKEGSDEEESPYSECRLMFG